MIKSVAVPAQSPTSDAELVSASLRGNRDAFGHIVTRYQTLVCSLAYSGTGSVSQSEDVAQEVFLTAWRQLSDLREPSSLRAWLCGITRNLAHAFRRRGQREPSAQATRLELAAEPHATGPAPSEQLISAEETALLWRSLERIPELYREPLVLFYRQHQSIEQVAAALDLTEDTVKQRLSRGRKLLRREVASLLEGTLERTTPSTAFTYGVIAALPLFSTSATAATIGSAAVKGSMTAKLSAAVGLLGTLLGPAVGIWAAVVGWKASLERVRTDAERRFLYRSARRVGVAVALLVAAMFGFIAMPQAFWRAHPLLGTGILIGLPVIYMIWMARLVATSKAKLARLRAESGTSETEELLPPYEYRSRWSLFGLPLVHVRLGRNLLDRRPARGWIAIGDIAYGLLFAAGGVAYGPVCIGGVAVGVIAIGGASLGLFAYGGLAIAWWAVGGAAIGYDAFGGSALAWHGAMGGFVVARELALSGAAYAPHANDAAAAVLKTMPFFRCAQFLMGEGSFIIWLPMIFVIWFTQRHTKAARQP